jgi:tRNA-dihydrouridine synthase A
MQIRCYPLLDLCSLAATSASAQRPAARLANDTQSESSLAGVDEVDSYQQLCDFVRTVSEGSPVRHFVVHCRKALLNLNTVKNRTVPPLRRGWAFALRRDFPHLQFSVNGQACVGCVLSSFAAERHGSTVL